MRIAYSDSITPLEARKSVFAPEILQIYDFAVDFSCYTLCYVQSPYS